METILKLVLIEDVETDAELIIRELRKGGLQFQSSRIETKQELIDILANENVDVIISDFNLPTFNALDALKIRNTEAKDIPFILVTGAQSEEIAVACIREGADDYILKGSLTRLPSSVSNSIKTAHIRTERSKALKQLQLREEKYRHLFENSLVGMLRWNLSDGNIIETNHKAKEFTGLFCEDQNFFHHCFLNDGDYEIVINSLRATGEVQNFDFPVKIKNGEPRWLSLSAKIFDSEGEIEGVIQDISKSKESIVELERVNYELDRFVYHASHDLKSPLRSIMGLVQAARESKSLEECFTYLDMFEQCTYKLEGLLNDLLTLARSNRSEEILTVFDFDAEINDSIQLLSSLNKESNISIIKEIRQTNVEFKIDAVRMRIILNNLIANALKYHRPSDFQFVKITIEYIQNSKILIVIEDNGEGILDIQISRIFDMFYRASTNSEGSGLGLYLVKSMIEKMNGKIDVNSNLGEGTKFSIVIPNNI